MAIFNKESGDRTEPRSSGTPTGEGALSIIASGMRVTGDIESTGVVKIEGVVEGTVRAARQVLLGRQGSVKGDIHAREIVLGGRVEGSVIATDRVELQGTSLVNGDIHTRTIVVLEGGRINGSVRMEESVTTAAASTPAKTESDSTQKPAVSVMR